MIKGFAIFFFLFLFSIFQNANAGQHKDMTEFFAVKENQEKYENTLKTGFIDVKRKWLVHYCNERFPTEKTIDCLCYENELSKVSDQEVFYDSSLTQNIFKEMLEAKQNRDPTKLEKLQHSLKNRNSLSKRLEEFCRKQ